ncbi:uncharacterized protein LOC131849864 isoform X2 [Achroia grisella]|uniref:uncharacterized protein LOC131849864 isoform X2 n=1 Tax=Achroia grisella TaxID=688607 RepID=UPI0027D2B424|nr:uncharacterized protein LOC131849864 isoform X2 [Achroia grisella]
MGHNNFSDYGSASSFNSFSSWEGQLNLRASNSNIQDEQHPPQKSSSYMDLVMKRSTLEDALEEFRQNGFDSPYNPDEEKTCNLQSGNMIGMCQSSMYLRQKSWPEPESTPTMPLPQTNQQWTPRTDFTAPTAAAHTNGTVPYINEGTNNMSAGMRDDTITPEQLRVLSSLPLNVVYSLLRELEQICGEKRVKKRVPEQECRFCKNNGERLSYYRSHPLRDADGVACPVLRAFTCPRCGARGPRAHTAKYCPLSTNEERMKSAAMMRSVRMASGRIRSAPAPVTATRHVTYVPETPQEAYGAPLAPLWAALEQKLML